MRDSLVFARRNRAVVKMMDKAVDVLLHSSDLDIVETVDRSSLVVDPQGLTVIELLLSESCGDGLWFDGTKRKTRWKESLGLAYRVSTTLRWTLTLSGAAWIGLILSLPRLMKFSMPVKYTKSRLSPTYVPNFCCCPAWS